MNEGLNIFSGSKLPTKTDSTTGLEYFFLWQFIATGIEFHE